MRLAPELRRTLAPATCAFLLVLALAHARAQKHSGVTAFTSIVGGSDFTCGLREGGEAYCWGSDAYGQLGLSRNAPNFCDNMPTVQSGCSLFPIRVDSHFRFASLAAGAAHVCGVTETATVACWGSNSKGQLAVHTQDRCEPKTGELTTGEYKPADCGHSPTFVPLAAHARALAAGNEFTCVLMEDGSMQCAGHDLGDKPVAFAAEERFEEISAGFETLCARTSAGRVACWSMSERQRSRRWIDLPEPSVKIAANEHSCAIGASGQAYCWGSDFMGGLGAGPSGRDIETPVPVLGGHTFVDIAVNYFGTCAITAQQSLYCWGSVHGAPQPDTCVSGSSEFKSASDCARTPQPMFRGTRIRSVTLAGFHYCAIAADGITRCWGASNMGQLGDGVPGFTPQPQVVGVLSSRSPYPSTFEKLGQHSGYLLGLAVIAVACVTIVVARRKRAAAV